ncbi:sugar phosphate isomerase/epimerase family protein [Herbaspirillum rubrisubalbicans]|uniref:Sugar phosphate isomerase/epimerase n=1 Tax=Herbaspirillum rubrisubalbicans TaxID=80842 RepID=A0AAD0UAR1_9BURK|nr:sugar phosphate isomerase/epimerase family protein [Herbaspirillum rubrisubalbicans]AYR25923.1 sugar phosphate isomerase/epimerase [Herbaspirillum rubrisubalbicans]
MNLDHFGMDTITLPGGLESKLQASKAAGFSQIMLWSKDLVGHPGGLDAAVKLVRDSGVRVTGIQVMRDYEGLQGTLHDYKVDVAKNLLQICKAVGSPLLLVCSSTSQHASGDARHIARDLSKLANLAVPLGIRVGFEALSWGRHINQYMQAWEVVEMADHANLGVVIDSFHILANRGALEDLDAIPGKRIVMVQLSDFMWREIRTPEERLETARHLRVFPGEGEHSLELSDMVRRLHRSGYRGDYSFEVFNDDYLQMSPAVVAERARRSAKWVTDQVLRRGLRVREPVAA